MWSGDFEHLKSANHQQQRLDITLGSLIAGKELAKEALIDLLKSTFNLMIQYPRMMQDTTSESPKGLGELWDDRFERCVVPRLTT